MDLSWSWSYFLNTSWLHRVARLFGFRPYALFPAPVERGLSVYLVYAHTPAPARALAVGERWTEYRTADNLAAELEPWAARMREAAQEAADRLACPTGTVLYVRLWYPRGGLEKIQIPGVALVVAGWESSAHPDRLQSVTWALPRRTGQPQLPPYPFRPLSNWPLEEWDRDLGAARHGTPHEAYEVSRSLARRALEYLREASARCLMEGPEAARTAEHVLQKLATDFGGPPGRRYRLWVAFYLTGVVLTAATFGMPTHVPEQLLRHVADAWDRWSRKERRVVVRGMRLVAEKCLARALPEEDPCVRFLRELPEDWLRSLFAMRDWRLELVSPQLLWPLDELGHPAAKAILDEHRPWSARP